MYCVGVGEQRAREVVIYMMMNWLLKLAGYLPDEVSRVFIAPGPRLSC